MHLSLRPGFVYLLQSVDGTRTVKVGRSSSPEDRRFQLALANPALKLVARLFFLDAVATETALKKQLASHLVERETFKISASKATRALQALHVADELRRAHVDKSCRFMADVGELALDTSKDKLVCDGSALSVILGHVPSARDGRTVRTLLPVALATNSAGHSAMLLLVKYGLLAYRADGLVLFDRTEGSLLEKVFKRQPCRSTWRNQLARYAGVNENGNGVSMQEWLDTTRADSVLVEQVCPL